MAAVLTSSSAMSLSPKALLHRSCFNELPCIYTSRVPTRFHLQKSKSSSSNLSHFQRLCSVTGDNNVSGSWNSHNKNHDHEAKLSGILPCFPGSGERSEMSRSSASNDVLKKLKRYGISGILSYGLLNTAYYLTTFLVVWFYVAPAPGKMGYFAAAESDGNGVGWEPSYQARESRRGPCSCTFCRQRIVMVHCQIQI
ncbi:PREDICTED: uncharacterized protein LOC105122862 isoform X3 [Populus euphratica]|uniref:Uncharacterized protein LOC105122862 isoform X3 n=1 Tax=Populus euphratica TaxID=75702 RepID=A0AAJ6U028_POPEU|nr:PREDICTED: uncharacterized protein LOC105122862 isoform X3 [Populus euphratica]